MLEKRVWMGILYHVYGPLLTERQQDLIELYYMQDLSLGEIALEYGISRQAVHDNLRRAQESLEGYEARLNMEKRMGEMRSHLLQLQEALTPLLSPVESDRRETVQGLLTRLMHLLDGEDSMKGGV